MNPNAGSVEYNVEINTSGVAGQISDVNQKLGKAGEQGSAAFGAKFGAVAGITQSIFNKVTNIVGAGFDKAINRVDALDAFPRVLQSMGFSADEAQASTKRLVERLEGLPTSLDQGTDGVQRFITAGLDVNKATETFLAVNDAILAAGGGAAQSESAMLQFGQALSRGVIEGQEWNSLVAAMPTAFQILQKESGLTLGELEKLYKTNPQKLADDLVRIDKEGGGSLASLEQQARDATGGIGTSIDNMHNAVARGIGAVIEAIGKENINTAIAAIGDSFESAGKKIGDFINYVVDHKDVFGPLAAGVAIFAGAIIGLNIIMGIAHGIMVAWNVLMGVWKTITVIGTAIQWLFNASILANPITWLVVVIVAVIAALIWFFTQTEVGQKIFEKFGEILGAVWDAILGAIKFVWNWLKDNWPLLLAILTGPIGIAVLMIVKHWDTIKEAFAKAWEFIKGVWSAVAGWFADVWNGIKGAFSAVGNWFRDTFSNAWNNIKNIFSNVGGWFRDRVSDIVNAFSGIGSKITGFFSGVWNNIGNALKDILNSVLHLPLKLPKIDVPGIGSVGGQTLIPRMARGGIVDSPTTALIGEAGAEAVVPLENNTEWIDKIAKKMGGNGGPTTIIVKLGEETIATRVIDLINDKTKLSGSNAILV